MTEKEHEAWFKEWIKFPDVKDVDSKEDHGSGFSSKVIQEYFAETQNDLGPIEWLEKNF